MESRNGLHIAWVDAADARDGAWRGLLPHHDLDIVRVDEPAPEDRAALAEAGFIVKPALVNWVADLTGSDEEFTARLPASERRNLRLGRRCLNDAGLSLSIRDGLDEERLDAFLTVYDAQVERMRNGVNYARRHRDRLLAQHHEQMTAFAYDGERMVAGCILWLRPSQGLLQLRFAAATAPARRARVLHGIYAAVFRTARELGLPTMSLGNDTSAFGHIAQPGLFRFKCRLGFAPVPAGQIDEKMGGDEADLFVDLRRFSDPSLVLGYEAPRFTAQQGRGSLRLTVLSREENVDLAPYRTRHVTGIDHRRTGIFRSPHNPR
ncbi:GNAT family N-acetyltransferase [Streptomyces sp. NPDC059696]|uniref:GNAT family N-acetyltransferase n=1 Tax=Streptomyces sp. NPDC059696 TaxID=3346911 RepID=UPI0036BA4A96